MNKRPMGHIAHLRKQFKSINRHISYRWLKEEKNINFSIIYCFFIWRNLNPPHSRMLCAKIGWNWLSGSEKEFFNFVNAFSLFYNYLPLEKGGALHLNKIESPSLKDALWQVWLKLAQWFWRGTFLHFVNVFSLFRNYLPLE